MALARFILILLVIFFIIRVITRFVVKKYIKNMQKRYEDQHHPNKNEGDVTIKSSSDSDKKIDNDVGDYVDYEEVDED